MKSIQDFAKVVNAIFPWVNPLTSVVFESGFATFDMGHFYLKVCLTDDGLKTDIKGFPCELPAKPAMLVTDDDVIGWLSLLRSSKHTFYKQVMCGRRDPMQIMAPDLFRSPNKKDLQVVPAKTKLTGINLFNIRELWHTGDRTTYFLDAQGYPFPRKSWLYYKEPN